MISPRLKPARSLAAAVGVELILLAWPRATIGAACLELAPMIGHTSSTDTRIWAKASESTRLSVRIGQRPDLFDGRTVRGPKLEAGTAFMGQLVVSNLQPAMRYYYCLLLDGKRAMLQPYPSFASAPPEGRPGHVRVA